jgi:hypothetical protein
MKKYLVVVALAAIAVIAVVASSGAQAPGAQTLVLEEGGGREKFIDHPPKSRGKTSTGDALVLSNSLTGSKNGSIQAVCTVVVAGLRPAFLCQGVAHLNDGDLLLEARFKDREDATVVSGAITGGTGAYANARGTFTSQDNKGGVSTDTFVFTTS